MRALVASTALVSAAVLSAPPSAMAQTATNPATTPSAVAEIVVTGSRVDRAGFSAPTPTTVIGAEILKKEANNNIATTLNLFPALRPISSAANSQSRSNTAGSSYADLRSLGSVRTLVLVDGRRVVPSYVTGQVDLNLIPSILVDRIDVVTGGASAAYGSDAVAGVVNLSLNTHMTGLKGDASYGLSQHRDNEEYHIGLAGGIDFAGGRGNVTVGGEYVDNLGAGDSYTRGWGKQEYGILANPTPGNGSAAQLIVPGYHYSNITPGGLIVSGPLKGTEFGPGGAVSQFSYGNPVGPSFMSGGEGYGYNSPYSALQILDPVERDNILGHVSYALTDRIDVFAEASYAHSHTTGVGGQPRDTVPLKILSGNPYIPASVQAAMTADGLASISVGRNNLDLGYSHNIVDTNQERFALGAKGSFSDHWRWDAYAEYGENHYDGQVIGARINANFTQAINAVSSGGQIVCRSTLTSPTNGCVPANIFGSGSISDAAKAYVLGNEHARQTYHQTVASANLHGEPFSTWAGSVSVATGFEYRKEDAVQVADPLSETGAFNLGNPRNLNGGYDVEEGYFEAVVPLLHDSPIGKSFDVDAAVRETHYSISGNVTTWKVGANYQINDIIRLRATRSLDIRAPNISELFTQAVQGNTQITNPATGVTNLTPNIVTGNLNLKPERAYTTTAGIVLTPSFIPSLQISVDYYSIAINQAIGTLQPQDEVNLCYAGNATLCANITTSGANITSILLPTLNLASFDTTGFDIAAQYRVPIDRFFGEHAGSLKIQAVGTYIETLVVNTGVSTLDHAGEVTYTGNTTYGAPHFRGNLFLSYDNGPFDFTPSVRYVGGGHINNALPASAYSNGNNVDARVYVDLSTSYKFKLPTGRPIEIYGVIDNLLDEDPPIDPTLTSPTDPVLYDVIGRTFKVGFRFNW